jgi:MFS family permease
MEVIKDVSPVQSGVNLLPAMVAQTVSTIFAGGLTTLLGYYNPFLLAGSALLSIGSGLFATMQVSTDSPHWIGYQVVFGLGAGMYIIGSVLKIYTQSRHNTDDVRCFLVHSSLCNRF